MLRETIKKHRTYASITQKQMARLLDMSVTKYLRKENGQFRIERDEVVKIARILKLDEQKLITYWMADNLYEFLQSDRELAEEAIGMVMKNYDNYDHSLPVPGRSISYNTMSERALRQNVKL